jgi:hypothetical protein
MPGGLEPIFLFVLLQVAEMTGVYHQVQPLLKWSSLNFLPWLASNYNPPYLHLLSH